MAFKYLLVLVFLISSGASGAVRYVSDTLYVPVRTGPTGSNKILFTVKTGDRVDLVGKTKNGFVLVRSRSKGEGWMPERYLLDKPVARERLAAAEKRLEKTNEIAESLKVARQENRGLVAENKKLAAELERITSVSGQAIALNKTNKELGERLTRLQELNASLSKTNTVLSENTQNQGMKLGIGAVLAGVLLGVMMPYLKTRRRHQMGLKLR